MCCRHMLCFECKYMKNLPIGKYNNLNFSTSACSELHRESCAQGLDFMPEACAKDGKSSDT